MDEKRPQPVAAETRTAWQKRYPEIAIGKLKMGFRINGMHLLPIGTPVKLFAQTAHGDNRISTLDDKLAFFAYEANVAVDHWHDDGQCCECGSPYHCCCDCPQFRNGDTTGLDEKDVAYWKLVARRRTTTDPLEREELQAEMELHVMDAISTEEADRQLGGRDDQ